MNKFILTSLIFLFPFTSSAFSIEWSSITPFNNLETNTYNINDFQVIDCNISECETNKIVFFSDLIIQNEWTIFIFANEWITPQLSEDWNLGSYRAYLLNNTGELNYASSVETMTEDYVSSNSIQQFNFIFQTAKSGILFGKSGESQTAIQNGGSMLASVATVSTGTFSGIFPYLMLSTGVFIGFYIIQQIVITIGLRLNPEKVKIDKEKAEWTGRGTIEKDVREFKKKKRSRIKRGLE